ncbi:MAG: EamA family transporter [Chloroflexi bacterium]|nr:EamA family transporter [Chloroflexota bacterium]
MSVVVSLTLTQLTGITATVVLVAASGEAVPGGLALAWAALAGASGVCGLGAFYIALARGTMGLVAPLAALIAAAVPAVVGLANGAAQTPPLLAGIATALLAVVLISLPARGGSTGSTDGRATTASSTGISNELSLVLLAGLGFAGFFLAIDQARAAGGETWWPIMMVRAAGLAVVALLLVVMAARRRFPSYRFPLRLLPLFVLSGLGDLGGNLFFLLANAQGDLAIAVVLSSLYPIVTALLARLFLHERLNALRTAGVGLAVVGVVLIAVGQL